MDPLTIASVLVIVVILASLAGFIWRWIIKPLLAIALCLGGLYVAVHGFATALGGP